MSEISYFNYINSQMSLVNNEILKYEVLPYKARFFGLIYPLDKTKYLYLYLTP